ncbi:hypothetical protein C8A03DRAFT_29725 [Achaetomium macrosporum]|uniref:Uncharacterized protein n=1 Tax=Achaetomium macrosporum TaxID=79813 RepID=A0AAN7CHZ1_9PEZI|nr:hypothetical protein C8A03DRAFT_29725 [Achaetomium macrosporum]
MKLTATLSFVFLAVAAVLEHRHWAGNNCNRAVTGTRQGLLPLASRSADCSSFLLTTVTPAATTVTVTVDEEDFPSPAAAKRDALLEGRQVTVVPSSIPNYAGNCVNAAEYVSACSCFGVTGRLRRRQRLP